MSMKKYIAIKCQCCGGCMAYEEKTDSWVCPDCGYRESYGGVTYATGINTSAKIDIVSGNRDSGCTSA